MQEILIDGTQLIGKLPVEHANDFGVAFHWGSGFLLEGLLPGVSDLARAGEGLLHQPVGVLGALAALIAYAEVGTQVTQTLAAAFHRRNHACLVYSFADAYVHRIAPSLGQDELALTCFRQPVNLAAMLDFHPTDRAQQRARIKPLRERWWLLSLECASITCLFRTHRGFRLLFRARACRIRSLVQAANGPCPDPVASVRPLA
jgi:hypothetical protein